MTNKPLLGPRKTKDDKKLHWEGSSEHLRKALDLSKIVTGVFSWSHWRSAWAWPPSSCVCIQFRC